MSQKKIWALLTVAFLLVGTAVCAAQTKAPSKPAPAKEAVKAVTEKPKEHQATGTVVSSSASSLTISKGKAEWTFVVTPKTKTKGTVAKAAKVTVHYHEDKGAKVADRIKVHEAKAEGKAPEGKGPAKPKASKSKS